MLYLTSWVGEEKIEQAAMHRTATTRDKTGTLIAEDMAQGDFLRDASNEDEPGTSQQEASGGSPSKKQPSPDAPAFEAATPADGDKDPASATCIEMGGLAESSGSGEDGIGKLRELRSSKYLAGVELLQGDDERMVTSKWFTTVGRGPWGGGSGGVAAREGGGGGGGAVCGLLGQLGQAAGGVEGPSLPPSLPPTHPPSLTHSLTGALLCTNPSAGGIRGHGGGRHPPRAGVRADG
jgi:hypothetical protein